MRSTTLLVLGLLLLGFSAVLVAAEEDEFRERDRRAVRTELEREIVHLRERLLDLAAKERELNEANAPQQELVEVREQIIGIGRELKQLHAHRARRQEHRTDLHEHAEKFEVATRRIHHIRVAAENLKAAELHRLAGELMEKAESMEREVQKARKHLAAEMKKTRAHREAEGLGRLVKELRKEVERLRDEVKELRQQVERR